MATKSTGRPTRARDKLRNNFISALANDFEKSLKGKTDPQTYEFSSVITRIRETIYQQKFEGAAVGAFNANIIARDLGLADKTINDTTIKGAKVVIEEIADDGGESE